MIKLIQKLESRESHPKYLDFVLRKSVDDLRREGNKRLDYDAIEKYFSYLEKAPDSLKAAYALMQIAKMRDTAVYLLFILKKSGEGMVDFDTLEENARMDCEFIKSELVKNFTLSGEETAEPELRIPEVSGTGLSELLKESNFKVESEENESITEEFSGMEMYDEDISDEEFELIKSEDSDQDLEDAALELISSEEKILKDDESDDNKNDDSESNESTMDAAAVDSIGMAEDETMNVKDNVLIESEESNFDEIYDSEDGMIEEKVDSEEELTEELLEEKTIEEVLEEENKNEEQEDIPETDVSETIEESSNTPGEERSKIENDEYKEYESTLLEVNELLSDYFLDIESVTEGAAAPDGEPVLFGKIAELCYIMQERSDKMSFSIISSIYNNIGGIFRKYVSANSRPVRDEMDKFRAGIRVVEGLIMGYEMEEADDIIASLYNLRKSFDDSKKPVKEESYEERQDIPAEESEESTGQDIAADEISEHNAPMPDNILKEKYSSAELRESFKQMKAQILDLEKTFNALDEIEGDYQNYEGLRKLSTTFNNLKEIIRRANMLELVEVAKLSEASYVFIKFIQNYRMNPFDDDIREIFKYIIYNFKAASLDKPNDDMERFISYLNDPVKIFTQKNKK